METPEQLVQQEDQVVLGFAHLRLLDGQTWPQLAKHPTMNLPEGGKIPQAVSSHAAPEFLRTHLLLHELNHMDKQFLHS